ncbi:MAG: MATE family efflux transporter [Lachnospiraceae bacterium]|nr:MATE family efflux transporter [Lachnospiraceae bacterium]
MAAVDMTEGKITRHLIRYSVPLVLGNLFQLTYNAVDSIIAGRFIGKEALAAEGMASPVMNIVILGISGICMGAGVLMSEFFGAKQYEKLKREMATAVLFGLYFSLVVIALGIAGTPGLLRALNVPEELMGMTTVYLRIIFIGAPFTYFYNALASALKSVGDSKTPLKFLMFSSVLNGVLDLIFIGILGFGIVCSAVTTVVAEAVSAGLSIWYVYHKIPALQLKREEFRIDGPLLKMTLQYGTVTALQQSCQPVGKLLIQGSINTLGVDTIAAFNAVTRMDDFAFTPGQSISHGITTFVAQNRGAKKTERMHEGFRKGIRLEFLYWICICGFVLVFRRPIVGLFVTGESAAAIVTIGSQYLGTMAFFYLFPAMTNGVQGFYRGMGMMKMTLLGTFIQTSLRVIFTWVLTPRMGIYGVAFACAIGWSVMLLVQVPYYFRERRSH